MMGDVSRRHFIRAGREELLFRLHLGVSHCRGRGQPGVPAGLSRLANGFTLVEYYLWPEACLSTTSLPTCPSSSRTGWIRSTSVIGRVARRIWAVAMRLTGTARTSAAQKLKYHIQTSGRSLHAQEIRVQRRAEPHLQALMRHLRQLQLLAHQRL